MRDIYERHPAESSVDGEDLVVSNPFSQLIAEPIEENSELDRLEHISTMALSGNTLVPLFDGTKKLLRDIAEGDEILNNKGEPTTVIDN